MESYDKNELPTKTIFSMIFRSIFYSIYRVLVCILAVILGILFAIPMFMGIINVGNICGLAVCVFVFCFYNFRMYFSMLKYLFYKAKASRIIWNILKYLFYAFLLYGLTATILIAVFANIAPSENATAVVLGAKVSANERPSRMLSRRINAAQDYLVKNPDSSCVATGGKGDNEPISEALCIYRTLESNGISANRLYIEDKSVNTKQNISNAKKIISDNKLSDDLAIATDGFHQLRARIIARKSGFDSKIGAVSAKTDFYFVPTYIVREWFALAWEVVSR